MTGLDSLGTQADMEGQLCKGWDDLHLSAPSKSVNLWTGFAWLLRSSQLRALSYFEIPMAIARYPCKA